MRICKIIFPIIVLISFSVTLSLSKDKVEAEPIIIQSEEIPTTVTIEETQEFTKENIEESVSEDIFEQKLSELDSITDKKEKILAYIDMEEEWGSYSLTPSRISQVFTEEEIYLIARCVETEVFDRDFESRVNICSVVLNRLNDEEFGDTVAEVIIPGQFAFWRTEITEDTWLAIEYAYVFGSEVDDALWFHSFDEPIDFYGTYFYSDSCHHFYHRTEGDENND